MREVKGPVAVKRRRIVEKNSDVITYLETITEKIQEMQSEIGNLNHEIGNLNHEIGNINDKIGSMSQQMDAMGQQIKAMDQKIETMDQKIETMDQKIETMDKRLEKVEDKIEKLDEKIDMVETALDTEINSVYKIALENKNNIETLLIPYNDRNLHINTEISKIEVIDVRLDAVETVVGEHSMAIRKLQATSA